MGLRAFFSRIFFVILHAKLCAYMKLLLAIGLIALAFFFLAVGVVFRKDHEFRSQHIAGNKRMKQDKIHCATSQDREARRDNKHKIDLTKL